MIMDHVRLHLDYCSECSAGITICGSDWQDGCSALCGATDLCKYRYTCMKSLMCNVDMVLALRTSTIISLEETWSVVISILNLNNLRKKKRIMYVRMWNSLTWQSTTRIAHSTLIIHDAEVQTVVSDSFKVHRFIDKELSLTTSSRNYSEEVVTWKDQLALVSMDTYHFDDECSSTLWIWGVRLK